MKQKKNQTMTQKCSMRLKSVLVKYEKYGTLFIYFSECKIMWFIDFYLSAIPYLSAS